MRRERRSHAALLIAVAFLLLAGLGGAYWLIQTARTPIQAVLGPWALVETDRELTGQQRASRVVFTEKGRALAVVCPRYNKVLLYNVTDAERLEPRAEIALQGRPVALATTGSTLFVLQRPAGDDKHLEPGWWEAFTLDGTQAGPRVPAGYYPDDLAVSPADHLLLVLNSGRAEGDRSKPLPGIDIFDVVDFMNTQKAAPPAPIGHVDLEPDDDAERLAISDHGGRVLVTLPKACQSVAIDLLDRGASPRVTGRIALPETGNPYVSVSEDGDWMIMPTRQDSQAVVVDHFEFRHGWGSPSPWDGYLLYTLPEESTLELVQSPSQRVLGRFPVKGPLNLGGSRPSDLAFSPERGLAAIATKPGTVHLVALRSRLEETPGAPPVRDSRLAVVPRALKD